MFQLEQRQRLGEEERRSAAAQTQLVAERSSSERRQRDLEARLTQLSEQLVATERGRSQDALTAAALRERCAQLQRDAPSERSSGLGTGPTGAGPAGAPRAPTDAVGRLLAELRLAVEHCPSRTDVEGSSLEIIFQFGVLILPNKCLFRTTLHHKIQCEKNQKKKNGYMYGVYASSVRFKWSIISFLYGSYVCVVQHRQPQSNP